MRFCSVYHWIPFFQLGQCFQNLNPTEICISSIGHPSLDSAWSLFDHVWPMSDMSNLYAPGKRQPTSRASLMGKTRWKMSWPSPCGRCWSTHCAISRGSLSIQQHQPLRCRKSLHHFIYLSHSLSSIRIDWEQHVAVPESWWNIWNLHLQTAQRLLQQFLCSTDLRSEINDFTDFSEMHHSSREEAPQLAQGLARHTSHIPSRPREMSCRVLPVFPDLQGHPRNPLALRPALKPARSCWH